MFGIDDAVAAVSNLGRTIVSRIWPDATEVEKNKALLLVGEMQSEFKLLLGQIEINKIEAASSSVFVSGARPFILWVCGVSLLYVALVEPFARFIALVFFQYEGDFPSIDTEITMQVLYGILGLGGYRSFEKYKKVSR